MDNKIYVVGHKNPDSDSICSALAYANLKRELGEDAIPCRLGPLNDETKYILKKFGFENPLLLKDARSQLRDIEIDHANVINKKTFLPKMNAGEQLCSEKKDPNNHNLVIRDFKRITDVIYNSTTQQFIYLV